MSQDADPWALQEVIGKKKKIKNSRNVFWRKGTKEEWDMSQKVIID